MRSLLVVTQHVLYTFLVLSYDLWINKRNPKYYGPVLTVVLAVSYHTGLLQSMILWTLFILVILLSILSGLVFVLCLGQHREPPAPRPTTEQQDLTVYMHQMAKNLKKHYYTNRLIISKDLDKVLQEVIDLVIRDFCLSWFRNVGEDETAFVEILNKQFWTVIENLKERLHKVDMLNFLCSDLIEVLFKHCQDLKLSDAGKYPGQTVPFLLHPCLKERNSEIKYLRTIGESLIYCLLPDSDSQCDAMRFILREILASSLILGTAETICDPDYINQTLVYYLEDRVKIPPNEKQKQRYAYAETYEDFIKMINNTTDIETLKQLRYHTIAEIMQATVIHNTKDCVTDSKEGEGSKDCSKLQSKKDALRERNLKKYINQCRVSKQQCEKRIRSLNGPDYRYYGLGHGHPLKGTEKTKMTKKKPSSAAILAFNDILDNSLARSFFMQYLQKRTMGNLLRFWIAIEKLRQAKQSELLVSAAAIFQEYVTPSAPTVIKLESRLVRGMEDFINGISERDSFYEAQNIVYNIMESKYYPEFLISPDYTKFVCESESALDDIRANVNDDQFLDLTYYMDEGFGFKERRKVEEVKETMPSNIEERNDYAVRTLQSLDHKISAKTQALELIKRTQPVDIEQKQYVEHQLEQLSTERRHLEFHIERTDLWCERLGQWKALIANAQYHPDNKQPIFVICVSCDDITDNENIDQSASPTGWVVCRQLEDFKSLHDKLKECCSWMSKELPVSSKKWYKRYGSESLGSLKDSLQEYLTIILGDHRLSRSDHIYTFLIPSPEHLRAETTLSTSTNESSSPSLVEKKTSSRTFISNIKESLSNFSIPDILSDITDADADEVEDIGIEEESPYYKKDSIAQPMYTLIGEIFELKGVFKVLRKTLITFVQVTFGGTINRHLREFVSWLVSEPMLLYYIDNFKQSWWPKGKLASYPLERTDLEKLRTREQAKERLMKSIPDVLVNLVGRRNSNVGFLKLFDAAQDVRTNKHLFYIFLELIVTTLCPEIKSNEF